MSNKIRIFTDGACSPNPGKMGIGIVVEWNGTDPTIISEYIGEGTNNIAEYRALIEAIYFIEEHQIMNTVIKSDSTLMVSQVNGKWKCNDKDLLELRDIAQNKIKQLKEKGYSIILEYIPRELNLADKPAKEGCNKNV